MPLTYSPTVARRWLLAWLALLGLSCASTEGAVPPLGRGPKSLAEAHRTAAIAKKADDLPAEPARGPSPRMLATAPSVASPTLVACAAPSAAAIPSASSTASKPGPAVAEQRPSDWLGDYRGVDTTKIQITGAPTRDERDPAARLRVELVKSPGTTAQLDFIIVDSSNGRDLCHLKGALTGAKADLLAAQACFGEEDQPTDAPKLITGQVELTRRKLVLTAKFRIPSPPGLPGPGSLEYEFQGER